MTGTTATIHLNYSFGLTEGVSQCAGYVDEQTVIYPAGNNLVLFNTDQRVQRFLPFRQEGGEGATALAVSSNRRFAAVAEKHEQKPIVIVFDLQAMRRRKILVCSEVTSSEGYVSLAFSPDSKYLVAQGGGPDWVLVYWQWEKAKVMAQTKIHLHGGSGPKNSASQVSFNPQDNTQICVTGDKLFKLFRYTEGTLKQFAFTKTEPQHYKTHAWLSEDQLLLGTDTGKIQLFEGGDLKSEFMICEDSSLATSKNTTPHPSSPPTKGQPIFFILPYSKGFLCSNGSGNVTLYEKSDDRNSFKKIRTLSIVVDPSTRPLSRELSKTEEAVPNGSEIENESMLDILSMSISASEENIVCSTRCRQLYILTLSAADLGKGAAFDFLFAPFHSKTVTGLDVSLRKPIIATCSEDMSVRIWNYENNSLDLVKEFQEEAHSISIHPSGLFLLVGFSEKLRLMNILIDDIRPYKELMIRGCKECCFSHGGHLFAAANANLIQIFSTFSFENTVNLKGHNGKVRSIVWNHDDSKIISCSADGAIYEWSVLIAKREYESVLKSCDYGCVSISSEPAYKNVYTVGTDHTLKEIHLPDSSIVKQLSCGNDMGLTQVVMSNSGRMLFAGTTNGTILSVRLPIGEQGDWNEYQAHAEAVTRMCISSDDQFLFSVGKDGTVFILRVVDKDGRLTKREKESAYAEEILITRSDLEEKNTTMSELRTRVEELKMESEYQLRLRDLNYNDNIKDLTDKFIQEIEALKAKNENLKTEKERLESRYEEEIHQQSETHSREVQERENTTNTKLMGEYEKYQELQARSQRLQEDYERQLQEMEDAREKALQELTEHYERKLHDKGIQLERAADDLRKQQREGEEVQRQMEEDTDQEILALKNHYERQLHVQSDENLKLRGDTGILRKKVDSLQNEIGELKGEIQHLKQEVKKREGIISSLRNDIEGMKKEIQERDDTINDKEKRIYDLKKKNQELEKFKFVLDYKIKELRKQMEPRENEIKSKKEQISKMEMELSDYSRDNKELLRQMEQQELKLQATTKEMMKERRQVHDLKVEIENFKCSLHSTTRHIQEPKVLKEEIKGLYKKYLKDYDEAAAQVDSGGEKDLNTEYARQRDHMEHTVASLRKKLTKDAEIHRADTIRVMQENVSLLKEINDLRRELKTSRSIAHDFEAALKIARKNGFDDQAILSGIRAPPPSGGIGKMETSDQTRLLELQKIEIGKLRTKIRELEGTSKKTERLPPIQSPLTTVQ